MLQRQRHRVELTGWALQPDGSVLAEMTCRATGETFTVALPPSAETGSAFSEDLALVAATFTLAFANLGLQRGLQRTVVASRVEAAAGAE
jgi:hypothetical protein